MVLSYNLQVIWVNELKFWAGVQLRTARSENNLHEPLRFLGDQVTDTGWLGQ